ncbi:nuclear transport factor 2 family protein [Halovivax sp.]|uniref:nuclear transport factor 2 family protein n=1 Tax=Halovivax sp. TaxID=1935978 RepID=UPI0025BE8365|nr:nuclear transport factor 2 family protein [Halovivax sp.]
MATATPPETQVLSDKVAITELMSRWFYLVDDGRPVEAVDRFTTEDVTFDAGELGAAEDQESWLEFTELAFEEILPFTRHTVHNPLIEVDGDTATGKWYLDCPTITGDGEAIWLQGTYEHEFRRADGEWLISKFTFEPTYATPFDRGWAEQPFVEDIPGELDW